MNDTFTKIEKHLKPLNVKTTKQVLVEIRKYYQVQGMSMNIKTMTGYALTYCVIYKIIDESTIDAMIKKEFIKITEIF